MKGSLAAFAAAAIDFIAAKRNTFERLDLAVDHRR